MRVESHLKVSLIVFFVRRIILQRFGFLGKEYRGDESTREGAEGSVDEEIQTIWGEEAEDAR